MLVIAAMFISGVIPINADNDEVGPAPNSRDKISDGSGFDSPNGQNNGPGPDPNAGEGISDGPNWKLP